MNCAHCGRPRPLNPWITGIRYDKGVPVAVLHQCECRKGEAPWASVTRGERQQAYLAEMSKWAACEMACE